MTKAEEQALREKPINQFTCSCGKADGLGFAEFKHHLFNQHEIKSDQMKGKKRMMMHIDGDVWYSYNYEWTMESGLKFTQYVERARDKNDPMRYAK